MKYLRYGLIALGLLFASQAEAATCFWVGGTGTWSTANTASWASATGGTAGTCAATGGVPKQAADTATFDGSSGGGTVTVDSTINGISLVGITSSAFTGTIDFSVNNPSMTFSAAWTDAGTGTHTLKLGSGTFTFTVSNGTGIAFTSGASLTLNAGTSTIATSGNVASGGSRSMSFGTFTYSTVSIGASTTGTSQILNGAATIGTFNIPSGPVKVTFPNATLTVTTAFNWTGSSGNELFLFGSGGSSTISVATGSPTMSWAALNQLIFSGGATFTATNSFDLKANSGITITPPSSGGGGGHIIGG